MSARRLRLGISPCPNDTFAFHGLITGAVRAEGLDVEIVLDDVEALNQAFRAGRLDASKTSFCAVLDLGHEALVLRAGSALGFGVGPLLLARRGAPPLAAARVWCPGEHTTAHFLYRFAHGDLGRVEQRVFSEIPPALERGVADYGVCIHEARFTYVERGLALVEDLGTTWERATRCPLPLGGIVARRALGPTALAALDDAIGRSIDHARAHPEDALETMARHATELDPRVLWSHVDLYVNEFTRDLGPVGRRALAELERRARDLGRVPRDAPALEVRDLPGAP